MTVSIKRHYTHSTSDESIEAKRVMDAVLADLTELRTAFVALTAKMDADFGDVTNASVDYATSVDPAELVLIS